LGNAIPQSIHQTQEILCLGIILFGRFGKPHDGQSVYCRAGHPDRCNTSCPRCTEPRDHPFQPEEMLL
jgi:hypothetical protein